MSNINVWKIGSRWSDYGDRSSSILDIFRKYNIVFCGGHEDIYNKVKKGDYIAISDGLKIVSVSKVLDSPKKITEYKFEKEDKERFGYEDSTVAIKVDILDLKESEIFKYNRGTFHGVWGEYYNKVISLYENNLNKFSIEAKTSTLLGSNPLLNRNIKYVVPVYQRPYSWGEHELEKFMRDIFNSYCNEDKEVTKEPMFIGTIQLSNKRTGENSNLMEQDIIDGQQRITTLMILLKILKENGLNMKKIDLDFSFIQTKVNNTHQQNLLDEFLKIKDFNNLCSGYTNFNQYIKNALFLKEFIREVNLEDEAFNMYDFADYILNNLYFVVIETKATLSKTLQIFDTINTAGMDLNGSDLFKIKIYEYLKREKGFDDSIFEKINELYKKIDVINEETTDEVISMKHILEIYQNYLIAFNDLPVNLFNMSSDTFFEKLFDVLLDIREHEHFKKENMKRISITLEDIEEFINIREEWEKLKYLTLDDFVTMNIFWWSRYSKHWTIIFLFLKKNKNYKELIRFSKELVKLYFVYSIVYQKSVYKIHSFSYEIYRDIFLEEDTDKLGENLINKIRNRLDINEYGDCSLKSFFESHIEGDIVYNSRKKNLLCRLSAALDEMSSSNGTKEAIQKIFKSNIDIEHIQAFNDSIDREGVQKEWGEILNSMGNLMILESSYNRSIGNRVFEKKKEKYDKSKFITPKKIIDYDNWHLEDALKRRDEEVEKIIKYIYG